MVDEQNKKTECRHCEYCKLVGKFFFISGAVFLGTLMALLLAHALLKPNFKACPMGMFPPRPGIERQMPPHMFGQPGQRHGFHRGMRGFQPPMQQPANVPPQGPQK